MSHLHDRTGSARFTSSSTKMSAGASTGWSASCGHRAKSFDAVQHLATIEQVASLSTELSCASRSRQLEKIYLVIRSSHRELRAVGAPRQAIGHGVRSDVLMKQRLGARHVPDEDISAVAD